MGWNAAAFVVAVYGAATSAESGRKQAAGTAELARVQGVQQKEQKKIANIKAARDRRKQARESRIAQAQIASATGGVESTKSQGAGGSVLTQAASAGGFAGQQQQGAQSIFEQGLQATQASADIASAQAQGQIGGAVGGLSTTFTNKSVQSIFK